MPEKGKKGKLAMIAHKFPFPPWKPQETAKAVTRNVSAVCQLPASGQAELMPVMLAFLSKILHNFDKTKRRLNIGLDLLVWIAAYKLSRTNSMH